MLGGQLVDFMAKIITEAEHVICQASPQRAVLVLNGLGSDAALALAFHLEIHQIHRGW